MQCDQLHRRIDELLDRREDIRQDREIAEHAAGCLACERRVRAFESMLLGIDLLNHTKSGGSFAHAELRPVQRDSGQGGSLRRMLPFLALAASLLIAIGPLWLTSQSTRGTGSEALQIGQTGNESAAAGKSGPAADPALRVAAHRSPEAVAQMFQATGRNLATLPQTVKRVATHPETDRIVGHILPLAEPVGAAWEVLLRAWPGATTPTTAIPETNTGYIGSHRAQRA